MGLGAGAGGGMAGGLFASLGREDKLFLLAQALANFGAGVGSGEGLGQGLARGAAGAASGILEGAMGLGQYSRQMRERDAERSFARRRMEETNDPIERARWGAVLSGYSPSEASRLLPRPRLQAITEGVEGKPDLVRTRVAELTPGATFEPYRRRGPGTGGVSANMARLDQESRSQWEAFATLSPDQRSAYLMGSTPTQRDHLVRRWFGEPEESYQSRLQFALGSGAMTGGIPVEPTQAIGAGQEGPGIVQRFLGFGGETPAADDRSPEEIEAELRKRLGTRSAAPKTDPRGTPTPGPRRAPSLWDLLLRAHQASGGYREPGTQPDY